MYPTYYDTDNTYGEEGNRAYAARRRIAERRRIAAQRRKKARRRIRLAAAGCGVLLFLGSAAALPALSKTGQAPPPAVSVDAPVIDSLEGGTGGIAAYYDADDETITALRTLAAQDPRAQTILEHADEYPGELLLLAANNRDALDFVVNYPQKKNAAAAIDLTREASGTSVPLLLQWDERWGYASYGSNVIGVTGCGPTCLSMVALYLTGNAEYDPLTVANWSQKNGYYSQGNGTSWTLMSEGSAHFGLCATELPLVKKKLTDALDKGCPIVCAMGEGDFTTTGHYIILTGYDNDGFIVNDPNSPTRSQMRWSYEVLEPQISNIWSFSKA